MIILIKSIYDICISFIKQNYRIIEWTEEWFYLIFILMDWLKTGRGRDWRHSSYLTKEVQVGGPGRDGGRRVSQDSNRDMDSEIQSRLDIQLSVT